MSAVWLITAPAPMTTVPFTFGRFVDCEVLIVDSDFLLGIVDSSECLIKVVRVGLSCQAFSV